MTAGKYVYVITDKLVRAPVAAFNDYEELCNWLYQAKTPQQLEYMMGWQLREGSWVSVGANMHDPVPVNLEQCREEGKRVAGGWGVT